MGIISQKTEITFAVVGTVKVSDLYDEIGKITHDWEITISHKSGYSDQREGTSSPSSTVFTARPPKNGIVK